MAAVICVVLGKTLGGAAADRFGAVQSGCLSLIAAGICFYFSSNAAVGLAALLLFNMSMPITLHGMIKILPKRKGFSFGLLTFALFLGFVPSYLGAGSSSSLVLAICSVSSACLLLLTPHRT